MRLSKWQVAKELGHDPAWISIRLGLQQASDDIKNLVKDGVIEDVRTLHELRKYEAEDNANAKKLINRIRKNQVNGSFRQVVANARKIRKNKKKKEVADSVAPKQLKSIKTVGNQLILKTKDNDKLKFDIPKKVLQDFLLSVGESNSVEINKILSGVN
jgi:hypothetical protein